MMRRDDNGQVSAIHTKGSREINSDLAYLGSDIMEGISGEKSAVRILSKGYLLREREYVLYYDSECTALSLRNVVTRTEHPRSTKLSLRSPSFDLS